MEREEERKEREKAEEGEEEGPPSSSPSPLAKGGRVSAETKTMSQSLAPWPLKTGPGIAPSEEEEEEQRGTLQRRSVRSSEADASRSDFGGRCGGRGGRDSAAGGASPLAAPEPWRKPPPPRGAQATRWIDPSWPDSLKSTGQERRPPPLPPEGGGAAGAAEEAGEGRQRGGTLHTRTSRKTEPPATHHASSSPSSTGRSAME